MHAQPEAPPAPDIDQLPPRQREILALVARGHSNVEIGRRLNITKNTVKTHLRAAFERLGARDRAHCVHLAHRLGVIEVTTADLDVLAPDARPLQQVPEFTKAGLTFRAGPPAGRCPTGGVREPAA